MARSSCRRSRQRSDSGSFGDEHSAGVPVYNYVVTIDDALMQITHVIRGDDHISNTPRQVAIYQLSAGRCRSSLTSPRFWERTANGSQASRATSIRPFRKSGYLPEALVNYLALLGWGAEDGEDRNLHAGRTHTCIFAGGASRPRRHLRLRQAELAQSALPQGIANTDRVLALSLPFFLNEFHNSI